MSEKIEGTIILDGLIEGRLPADPEGADKLRAWVKFASEAHLPFSLESRGGQFSLLPDNTPQQAQSIGPKPAEVIAAALRELTKCFTPPERSKVFSTLRSVEYQKGREVQVLYAFTPVGDVKYQDRVVDAHTTPPPQPLTRKEKVRLVGGGLLAFAIVFGLSWIFVPYGTIWRQMADRISGFDESKIDVDAKAFDGYFAVDKKSIREGKFLVLTLKRGPAYPRTPTDLDLATTRPTTQPFVQRLTLDALARGYVRVEYLDAKGQFIGSADLRIRPLADKDTIDVALPLSRDQRPARVVITY